MKNILIRTDSSATIGIGHIMRDLVLAKQFKNSNIIFATQNLKGNINHKIIESSYKLKILKTTIIDELIDLIKKQKIDLLIIDHYGINYHDEKKIKKSTDVSIFVVDDTYEKHHCDILLNHNISAKKNRYKNLVPKNCILKCGSKHTLIRDEFKKEKSRNRKKPTKRKNKRIFIAIGGADHSNINIKLLKTLLGFKGFHIDIVTTTANKNLSQLKSFTKKHNNINLHINSNHIAKLMNSSDFAIVTSSVTVNEILYLNLPFIAIKTADNQNDMYEYLKKKKFLILKKFDSKKLRKKITKIIKLLYRRSSG